MSGGRQKDAAISIITVCRNSESTIEQTIKSVISQDFSDIEYIVIDGGSLDGTLEIIKKFENRIDYWISAKDEGVGDAFNKGIGLARGKIIGIINSDDWYEDGALKTVADIFKEKDIDVLCGKVRYWDGDKPSYVFGTYPAKLSIQMTVNHPAVFVNKSCYDKFGLFDNNYKYAMDYDMMLRLSVNGCGFYNHDGIIANMGLGGLSDRNWDKAFKECKDIKIRYLGKRPDIYMYYCYQLVRHYVSNVLRLIGLGYVADLYKERYSIVRKEK